MVFEGKPVVKLQAKNVKVGTSSNGNPRQDQVTMGKVDSPASAKRKSLLWLGASQWRIYYHRIWDQLSTTCSDVLKQPNWELLVAVNHNQLRTMVSETVDSIDWSHPLPSWAVPPERHVHSINQCNLSGTGTCNRSMRGNHLAYAAT